MMDEREERLLREALAPGDKAMGGVAEFWLRKLLSQLDKTRAELAALKAEKPPSIWHLAADEMPVGRGNEYVIVIGQRTNMFKWVGDYRRGKEDTHILRGEMWAWKSDLIKQATNDKGDDWWTNTKNTNCVNC